MMELKSNPQVSSLQWPTGSRTTQLPHPSMFLRISGIIYFSDWSYAPWLTQPFSLLSTFTSSHEIITETWGEKRRSSYNPFHSRFKQITWYEWHTPNSVAVCASLSQTVQKKEVCDFFGASLKPISWLSQYILEENCSNILSQLKL